MRDSGWARYHPPSRSDLRVSDADRERAVKVLTTHTSEGRLSLDEFSDRVGEVYAARTFADLDATLRELPVEPIARPLPDRRRRTFEGLPWIRIGVVIAIVWAVVGAVVATFAVFPVWLIIVGAVMIAKHSGRPAYSSRRSCGWR